MKKKNTQKKKLFGFILKETEKKKETKMEVIEEKPVVNDEVTTEVPVGEDKPFMELKPVEDYESPAWEKIMELGGSEVEDGSVYDFVLEYDWLVMVDGKEFRPKKGFATEGQAKRNLLILIKPALDEIGVPYEYEILKK